MKKKKNPAAAFLWLLLIPLQLILDCVLFILGAYADVSLADHTAQGHPAPALSILAAVAGVVITLIVIVVAIIITAVRFSILKKRNMNTEEK
ncbi:MAG: hypothetical protein J5829_04150 [Lachnospiraceae bacterium]|nr:hypothetical protein [Lachnospiraceae bacterium]